MSVNGPLRLAPASMLQVLDTISKEEFASWLIELLQFNPELKTLNEAQLSLIRDKAKQVAVAPTPYRTTTEIELEGGILPNGPLNFKPFRKYDNKGQIFVC